MRAQPYAAPCPLRVDGQKASAAAGTRQVGTPSRTVSVAH